MRSKWLSVVVFGLCLSFAQSASAADVPVKAPILKAPPPAAINWTGLYVNGGFGYGLWAADTTTQDPTTGLCRLCFTQRQGGKGWLGVIGVGYDFQFAPRFLVGAFGDFNLSSLKGTIQDQDPYYAGDIKQQWSWAVGGRLGYLITEQLLAYINGGYTSAHFSNADMVTTFVGAPTTYSTPAFTAHGWFVGGGTESAFALFGPGWFWRNEYRYAQYDNETLPDTSNAGFGAAHSINFKPTVQTITTQLVYKLNTGGPTYPPVVPVAPVNWNGIYVNGGFGYGLWAADTTTESSTTGVCRLCFTQTQGGKGWLGVVGLGFDHQIMPAVIVGVFGDVDISDLNGTIQDQDPYFAADIKQKWAWAVGGRAGWLITPQVLTYGNVGYTQARFSGTNMVTTFVGASTSYSTPETTFHGWFIGSGVEAAIMPNLFWRTEYRLAKYDNESLPDTSATSAFLESNINFKPTVQTVTTQLVYKFNWPR